MLVVAGLMSRGKVGVAQWMLVLAIAFVSGCGGGDSRGTNSRVNHSGRDGGEDRPAEPSNRPPVASFTVEPVYDVPLRFRFSAAGSRDPDGSIVRHEWSIRSLNPPSLLEEVTATGVEATHTFWGTGYTVQSNDPKYGLKTITVQVELVVTDNDGATTEHAREFVLSGGLTFAGQEGLIDRVEAAGGPSGTLAILDSICLGDPDHTEHSRWSRGIARKEGTPDENIWFSNVCGVERMATYDAAEVAIDHRYANVDPRDELLVVSMGGSRGSGKGLFDAYYIRQMNTVWVTGTGNMTGYSACERHPSVLNRNIWNPNHSFWGFCPRVLPRNARIPRSIAIDTYYNFLALLDTGKVVVAVAAWVENNGDIRPYSPVASCGDLKEYCFAVPWANSTSAASPMLASLMYMFMQMYGDASEAVEALKRCAVDIGEPGVDREFGQGLIDLRTCPEARLPIIER